MQSSPATYGNMIYIGADDGSLYALNNDKKTAPMSVYVYYIGGGIVIIVALLLIGRAVRNRRKTKEQ
jgi:hypothetical protein